MSRQPFPIYVINLDRDADRLDATAKQLNRMGYSWRRLPAVDGDSLGSLPWAGFDHVSYMRCWGKLPSAGEVGCYLSHLRAMNVFLAEGGELALVLEDDVVFSSTFEASLQDAIACRDEWDVLKLQGFHRGMPMTTSALGGQRRLVVLLWPMTGSAAYFVNRRAARAYADGLLPMRVPYDHEFDRAWKYSVRLRGMLPFPVTVAERRSTIVVGRRFHWSRRLPSYLFRARTEVQRAWHYACVDNGWVGPAIRRTLLGR